MKNISFKTILPYVSAILIFIIVTFAYLSPLLEGQRLKQNDTTVWSGAAKEIMDFRKAHPGEEPLWTGSMFSGMPAYQISMLTPSNSITEFFENLFGLFFLPNPANMIFMYFLGFFILLLVLKVDPWLSIIGALAFGFSSYFFIIIEAGHNTKALAIGYMAPVLAGIILTMRGKYLWGGILTALFMALEIKMNHVQMTYYLFIIILIYVIAELFAKIKEKQLPMFLKAIGVLVIAGALALGTNITNLLTSYEYAKDTIRGQSELTINNQENKTKGLDLDYATSWSYGVSESMTLLIPDFNGGSSSGKLSESSETYKVLKQNGYEEAKKFIKQVPLYWGTQPFTSGPVYAGAIFIFLFVLGLYLVKGAMKWGLLIATILSIMLAWGKNFMPLTEFFFTYFPMYNKFRAVSSILVIAELTIPLLGILAVNEFIKNKKNYEENFKALKYSFFITGGITLIFAVLGTNMFTFSSSSDGQYQFPEWLISALVADRKSMFMMDAWRSFFLILATAALLYAILKDKLKWQYGFLAIGLLVVVDMWMVDKRYFGNENFTSKIKVEKPYTPTDVDELILQDKDPNYRVFNVTVSPFNDASTSYYHKSIGGYHGAKLRRYQDLIEHHISKNNVKVLNMLNTKYFIAPDANKQPQAQRNVAALGNAWFIDNLKVVESPDSEIVSLTNFEPATTAVVDKRFNDYIKDFKPIKDSSSTIKLTSYDANYLTYEANAKKDEFAVFSEIYYDKGWQAYIDSKPVEHIRVNYVLRAMKIPAGQHKIEFKFHPATYYSSEKIGYASSFILLFMVIGMAIKELVVVLRKK